MTTRRLERVDWVLLDGSPESQKSRFTKRERNDAWGEWATIWMAAEDHYVHHVMAPASFDVIIPMD